MTRAAMLMMLALILAACAGTAMPTAGPSPSAPPSPTAEPPSEDPVGALVADLAATGASAREVDAFSADVLAGQGVLLCVSGQEVRLYVYANEQDREAASRRIDPRDPSNLGTMIVEWAGRPTFWQRDRLIVLYLGSEPGVRTALTTVLGQPFADGQGRDPGPGRHSC